VYPGASTEAGVGSNPERHVYNPAWVSRAEMPRNTPVINEAAEPTYEQALAELEGLVQRMEAGQMPLDQMLDSYRRGAALLELCRTRLAAVEQQVKVLEDGQLKPWSPLPP
jgi:exodeoxyribonuclease VII small subunit